MSLGFHVSAKLYARVNMLIKPLKAAKKIEQEIVRAGGKTQVQSGEKHATSHMFGNSRSEY